MGNPREVTPRPDIRSDAERRRKLVSDFKGIVNRAVNQIQFFIPFETGMFGSLQVGESYLKYLPSSSHSPVERFTISRPIRPFSDDFYLNTVFTPDEDENRLPGISRKSSFYVGENPVADIGSRYLSLDEMKQLILVMTQTPMHASLIEGLVEPTEEERVRIEMEIEQSEKADRETRTRSRIIGEDSYWN